MDLTVHSVCLLLLILRLSYCSFCVSLTAHSVFLLLLILRLSYCSFCVSLTAHSASLLLLILCVSYCSFCVSLTAHSASLLLLILCVSYCSLCVSVTAHSVRTCNMYPHNTGKSNYSHLYKRFTIKPKYPQHIHLCSWVGHTAAERRSQAVTLLRTVCGLLHKMPILRFRARELGSHDCLQECGNRGAVGRDYVLEIMAKHMLQICSQTTTHSKKCLKKWFNMNGEVAYKKVLGCPNKAMITHLGRYVDKIKHKCGTGLRHVGAPGNVPIWRLEHAWPTHLRAPAHTAG